MNTETTRRPLAIIRLEYRAVLRIIELAMDLPNPPIYAVAAAELLSLAREMNDAYGPKYEKYLREAEDFRPYDSETGLQAPL